MMTHPAMSGLSVDGIKTTKSLRIQPRLLVLLTSQAVKSTQRDWIYSRKSPQSYKKKNVIVTRSKETYMKSSNCSEKSEESAIESCRKTSYRKN